METSRVWAELDVPAFTGNLRTLRERVGAGTRIVLVLKADAYGHGARELAPFALREGVDALGVATVGEALELRAICPGTRLLVLGTTLAGELEGALEADLELVVATSAQLLELVARGRRARIHLHFDTGMHRLGLDPRDAAALGRVLHDAPFLRVVGLMTHVASTHGADDPSATRQWLRFQQLAQTLAGVLEPDAWTHVANSAGVLTGLARGTNAVRVGLAAFGLRPPVAEGAGGVSLEPVLSLRTRVAQVLEVPPGEAVGYDGTWRAERRSWIATLAAGYADGLPFRLSNRGSALVGGVRVPLVGRISMDYAAVDLTPLVHAGGALPAEGGVVTLLGRDGDERIDAHEIAERAGTSPYEIVTRIGARVRRVTVGVPAPREPARELRPVPPVPATESARPVTARRRDLREEPA